MKEDPKVEPQDAQMQDASVTPTGPAAMSTANKKRPRLDLAVDSRERKRGKSIFGLLLGTLNKAKNEDKERSASEAVRHYTTFLMRSVADAFHFRRRNDS